MRAMDTPQYDDPAFFDRYATLDRSVRGLDGAPEWPALSAMLPSVAGRRVVDLGCGYGWFCRWAADRGAASVLGLDVSRKMLAKATAATRAAVVRYERADLETLALAPATADLVFSSLTLHYVAALPALLAAVRRALVPGGHLVFSVEHPILTAPARPGFVDDGAGHRVWPLDRYADEGPRTVAWLGAQVAKHHRTESRWVNLLIAAGFVLEHLDDWAPTPDQVAARPSLAVERDRPMFLLVAARLPRGDDAAS